MRVARALRGKRTAAAPVPACQSFVRISQACAPPLNGLGVAKEVHRARHTVRTRLRATRRRESKDPARRENAYRRPICIVLRARANLLSVSATDTLVSARAGCVSSICAECGPSRLRKTDEHSPLSEIFGAPADTGDLQAIYRESAFSLFGNAPPEWPRRACRPRSARRPGAARPRAARRQ